MERKKQIRQQYQAMRNSLPNRQVQEWSREICRHLITSSFFQQAETVYFYYPLGQEVSLLEAAQAALDQNKCVGFPKTEGDRIHFYQVSSLTAFAKGCFQVMEPVSDKILTKSRPLIFTPGLVFDKKKNRLGYGKGYYDKYRAGLPKAMSVGIAFQCQMTEELPTEEGDIPMQRIITEEGIW